MKFLIQRVSHASVMVEKENVGEIGLGFLVFIGVSESDTKEIADKMIKKLTGLRIFEDSQGKTNLALKDVEGSLLLVSQFTLYADCKRKPAILYTGRKSPKANMLYEYIIEQCKALNYPVQTGIFGADMKISLENDGPFTIILDSRDILGT